MISPNLHPDPIRAVCQRRRRWGFGLTPRAVALLIVGFAGLIPGFWDGRLAYAIKGHRKGLHYLVYFKMPGEGVRDLNRACKLNDLVLRHVVIQHPLVLFDAMVQAISGEWHPHEAAHEDESERPRGRDRDRGHDRDRVRDREPEIEELEELE